MDKLADDTQAAKPEWALSRRERKRRALRAAGIEPYRIPWLWLILLVAVGVAAVVLVPRLLAPPAPTEEVAAPEAPPVTKRLLAIDVTTAAPATLRETIKATGSLAPQRSVSVAPQTGGTVDAVNVRLGDRVEAGTILVQLDVETATIQLNQQRATAAATRAQLQQAESQLARTENLAQSGLTATSALELAQAGVEAQRATLQALEAQVASAEIAIRNATIVAPFAGIVAKRAVEPGQIVAAGTPLIDLVDLSTMEMTAYVPVGASPRIVGGQEVSLQVEGLRGQPFAGTVAGISPVAAAGTRTVPVSIIVPNVDGRLRGGMFASGQIVVEQEADVLAVPEAALRQDDEGSYVLAVEDGTLVRRAVTAGRSWASSGLVQIASGLAPGEVYVSGKLDDLAAGMGVTVEASR